MARRDYASKPRRAGGATNPAATRSAKSSSARKSSAQAKRKPFGLIIAALFATAALGGLVLFLSSEMKPGEAPLAQPEQSTLETPSIEQTVQQKIDEQPAVRAPGESLPLDDVALEQEAQQDERFGFYDLLKDTEVETPEESAYKSTPKTAALDTPYLLQTGSFRQQSDAEAMRARLTLAGLPNVRANKSGDWYRVTTGPFNTYNELKSATNKLEKLNIHPVKRKAN